MRAHGIGSDLTGDAPYGVRATSPLHRTAVVAQALADLLPAAAVGLVGLVAVAALGTRSDRARAVWFVGAQLLCTAALLVVYALGPLEIHSWVMSSLSRTSMTLRAGGLLAAVYAAGEALTVLVQTVKGRPVGRPLPDPAPATTGPVSAQDPTGATPAACRRASSR